MPHSVRIVYRMCPREKCMAQNDKYKPTTKCDGVMLSHN